MNVQVLPDPENTFTRIGRLLGLPVASEADLFRISRKGVSPRTLKRVSAALGVPLDLIGPPTTMRRRMEGDEQLKPDETERLLRVTRVFAEAAGLFGTAEAAKAWMHTPAEFVPGQPACTPAQLAVTDSGARMVEARIRRTVYGVF